MLANETARSVMVSHSRCVSLPTAHIAAPCRASEIAIAWPIPLLAPVTTATKSASTGISRFFLGAVMDRMCEDRPTKDYRLETVLSLA